MALADIFHHVETLEGSAWDEVQELAASGDQSLVGPVQAALERYLDDEDFVGRNLMAMDVRQTALGSLASLTDDRRAYELTVSALRDPDVVVRHSAVLDMRSFAALDPAGNLLTLTADPPRSFDRPWAR